MQVGKHVFEPSTEPPNLSGIEEEEEEEREVSEEELLRIGEELADLQNQFDQAVMEKHRLKKTCQQLSEKLKLAKSVLDR